MPSSVRFSFTYPAEETQRSAAGILEVGADDITFGELVEAFSQFSLMMGFSPETIAAHLDIDSAVARAVYGYTH